MSARMWVECEACGGCGGRHHECEDPLCACEEKGDVECITCSGYGGWYEDEEGEDDAGE